MSKNADIILVNGRIYTVDKNKSWAEAVAIKDNIIAFVGTNEGALEMADGETEIIDLEGRMMIPGLIDAHCHAISAAFFNTGLILDIEANTEEMLRSIREYVAEHADDSMYFGRGYGETNLFEMESPKSVLDEICPDKPIVLMGAGLHSAWCNSKALEIAGIDKNTPDPDPGVQYYGRLPNGEPDGNLVESDAMTSVLDELDPFTEEAVIREMKRVSDSYNELGVTAVQDGGAWGAAAYSGRKIMRDMQKTGDYNMRVETCEFVVSKCLREGVVERIKEGNKLYNDDYLRVGFLKVLDDGIFENKTAVMVEPYLDGTNCETLLSTEDLREVFLETAEAGFDIAVHNIGDKTCRDVLLGAKAVREAGYDDTRIASIHTITVNDDDYEMFKDYQVIANSSGQWVHKSEFKESMIGERAYRTFMLRTLQDLAPALSLGSDHPADEYGKSPFLAFEMGLTRQFADQPDMPILLPYSERMTVARMLEAYTMGGAYQMRMEDKIGSIEPGKYADLVVLEQNLFEIDQREIHNVKVAYTIFDGRIVYKR